MSLAVQATRSPLGMTSFGNQDEMEAVGRLGDAGYEDEFARAFPAEQPALSLAHFGSAVASFEQTLITPGSVDAFLKGDDSALTSAEQAGLSAFVDLGCAGCHSGPGFGGQMLQKFGVVEPYSDATGSAMPDQGRFDVTQDEADRFDTQVAALVAFCGCARQQEGQASGGLKRAAWSTVGKGAPSLRLRTVRYCVGPVSPSFG